MAVFCCDIPIAKLNMQMHMLKWNFFKFILILLFHMCSTIVISLKTKGRQFDNFAVTGGTVSCRNDNLRCNQWRQSCQIGKLLLYVLENNNALYYYFSVAFIKQYWHDCLAIMWWHTDIY